MFPKYKNPFTDHPPMPPCVISGILFINNQSAQKGVVIQAVLDSYCRGEDVTNTSGGFTLTFPIEGLDDNEMGKVFEFYANDIKCKETFTVTKYGEIKVINFNATGTVLTDPTALLVELRNSLYFTEKWAEKGLASVTKLLEIGISGDKPIPFFISSKRGNYSRNYLSEFITPSNLMVEDAAATVSNKAGDELTKAAYDIVASIRYTDDDRVWNCPDWWQLPHETLNRQCGDCEDTSFLLTSILLTLKVPDVRCVLGLVELSGISYGHAWVEVKRNNQWYWLETTWDAWRDWALVPSTFTRQLAFTDKDYEEF